MTLKEKGWLWRLSWPFAHDNYTTVGHTIYFPKGKPPSPGIVAHEEVHEKQIERVGFVKFYVLYLLVLPLFWNPWRKKWELEAGTSEAVLKTYKYGWVL